jgi:hypothetical protein
MGMEASYYIRICTFSMTNNSIEKCNFGPKKAYNFKMSTYQTIFGKIRVGIEGHFY